MKSIYTETIINHVLNPRNVGSMADAEGFASIAGSCGDTIKIWLEVWNGAVAAPPPHW